VPACGRNCRRLVGLIWFATWSGLIYLTVLPWRNLGGLVSEWLLWLERFVLYACLALGFSLGEIVRLSARRGGGKGGARKLRWLLYPAALGALAGMLLLGATGRHDAIGIVLTGLLAYAGAVSTSCLDLNRFCRGEETDPP
jgi:hypothetical protein